MEILQNTWLFFQDQVLGMKWLNALIGNLLSLFGLDVTGRIGGSVQFFIYDVLKITVLLCVLIFIISYIQSYFPQSGARNHEPFHAYGQISWQHYLHGDSILLLLLHTAVHWIYQCWTAPWRDFFFSDFLPHGRPWFARSAHEHLWRKGCYRVCGCGTDRCRYRRHSD